MGSLVQHETGVCGDGGQRFNCLVRFINVGARATTEQCLGEHRCREATKDHFAGGELLIKIFVGRSSMAPSRSPALIFSLAKTRLR